MKKCMYVRKPKIIGSIHFYCHQRFVSAAPMFFWHERGIILPSLPLALNIYFISNCLGLLQPLLLVTDLQTYFTDLQTDSSL